MRFSDGMPDDTNADGISDSTPVLIVELLLPCVGLTDDIMMV